jgi:hypothetical protein
MLAGSSSGSCGTSLGRDGRSTGIYARWHMFEEKREAVMAIETAVSPFMPKQMLTADRSTRL